MNRDSKSSETIFGEAINIASTDERAAYLDQACENNPELRGAVEQLVLNHFQAGRFLDKPMARFAATIDMPAELPVAPAPGTVIGPYKLREVLGEGGMGTVYAAEQQLPVRRKVALKVIKAGMDSRDVIGRFQAEQQALSLMDHPHIAKVLDAGTTDSGRPYFVMELVRGIPITEYCDKVNLSPRERLKLFVQVCQAVQHAHQKGIIHRDLKPSNVMVTLHDGVPVPKVIDFGVAKAINQRLTEQTVYTRVAQMVGTPLYMSPEQAELSGLDVDTRSDVYSLGVLLYELLAGTTPFDKATFLKASFDEVRRIIREDEPPRPSQRVSTLEAKARSTVSGKRGTDERKLTRVLQGELDWIVMKALEKDRQRRYESSSAFAADVQRYLDDQPVAACPPSAAYRLRKYARRNRATLTTLIVVSTALILGTALSTWQAFEATSARKLADDRLVLADERLENEKQARTEADEQRKQASANLKQALDAVDQMLTRVGDDKLARIPGAELVRKKILEDALRFYEEFLGQQNDALQLQFEVAQAMRRVGQIRVQLGRFNSASESYQRGIEMVERLVQKNPDNTVYLELLADLYEALYDSSSRGATWVARKNENSSALEQAIATRARLHRLLPDNVKHEFIAAKLQVTLAVQYHLGRSPSEACQLNDKAIEDLKRLLAANPDRHRDYVDLLAGALAFRATLSAGDGNARAAEIADDEAESEAQKFLAVNPERGQGVLGWVLFSHAQHQGDPSKRESLLRRTIAVMDNFVDAHPDSLYEPSNWAGAHSLLAGILIESGHNEEAERTLRTVVSATRLPAGVRAPLNEGAMHKTGYMVTLAELGCHRQLITLLRKLQRPDEAEAATRIWVNAAPKNPAAWLELGQLYNALGDADRTRQAFETVLSIETESFCGHSELAKSWQQSGEPAKALVHADRAIDIEPGIVAAWETKTKCHLELGDSEAAGQAWMRWVDLTPNERHFPAPEQSLLNCIKQMARAGKLDGARNFCDVLARSHGSGPMALDSRVLTAAIFQCLGENDRAKSIVTDVIRRLESGRPADQSEADHLRIVRACLSMMIDHMDLVAISDQTLLKRLGAIAEQVIISEKSSIGDCRELGVLHATLGLFDQARRDFECAVIAGNGGRQAGWYERYLRALCYLHDGDQAAYRTAAGEILARITASQDAKELHWTVWTCVLAPGGLDDYRLLVELARRGHDLQPADSQMNQALGAALFRASQFEQALPPLSECEAAPTTSNTTPVYVRYFLAMTHHKLRHETEARQWFDRAEAETNRMLGDGKTERGQPLAWNRRLTLELLRAEARALLGEPGQPPAPIKVGAEKQGP